ncbi:MAG: helix-turn-helix domain-containing protein [Campylobacterota bacterium]|nr:helix-turn-helix domain-containing protein [Campylobacterota bacterium]
METFFTTSEKTQHIIKSFNLTKTLFVSSIIIGEANTGKKSLARYLFPDAYLVSGENQEEVKSALVNHDELIITNFEKLTNQGVLDFSNKRIIATANYMGNSQIIDELFAFIYAMPPLQERPEDVKAIKALFIDEALSTLMLDKRDIDPDTIPTNLVNNTKSLKKTVFVHLMKHAMKENEIEAILYEYLLKHLEGNDGYREYLGLYEKPLIQAGLKKFGSQLQLSQVLGINRNTLRKKIHEHDID